MYDTRPNLVIGFHCCDLSRRESLLNNSGPIEKSERPYDWLGHGVYFWENNFARASEWAADKARRGEIKEPAVIGGVLNLGICCDLEQLHQPRVEILPGHASELSGPGKGHSKKQRRKEQSKPG